MNTIARFLPALLLMLAFASSAIAQPMRSLLDENRTLDANGKGQLRLDVENLHFFRDNEYDGGRTDGYTLPGFILRPTLSWQPLSNLKVEAGFSMTAYWGATYYQPLYFKDPFREVSTGEKKRVYMTPFVRVHAKLSSMVDLVIGNIYGGVAHGLPEPLYDEENMLTQRPEAGIQLLADIPHFDMDAWVNWESFIFRGDDHQEAFTFGLSTRAKANDESSKVHVSFPVNLLFMHRGGEIDTITSNRVQTWVNISAGGQVDFNLQSKAVTKLSLSLEALYSNENKGELSPYGHGAAVYGLASADIWRFKIGLGHFYGHEFISLLGNPHFGCIDVPYSGIRFDDTQVTTFNLEYAQEFARHYSWGANLKAFYLYECQSTGSDGVTVSSPGALSVAAAVYFRLSPSFLLKDFSKRH